MKFLFIVPIFEYAAHGNRVRSAAFARLFLSCDLHPLCLFMAPNGPPAMSAIWSLTGVDRTWRLSWPTSDFDPERKPRLIRSRFDLYQHAVCPSIIIFCDE